MGGVEREVEGDVRKVVGDWEEVGRKSFGRAGGLRIGGGVSGGADLGGLRIGEGRIGGGEARMLNRGRKEVRKARIWKSKVVVE